MKCVFCGNTKVLFRTTQSPFFTVCLRCAIENKLYHLRKVGEHGVEATQEARQEGMEEEGSRTLQPPLPLVWKDRDET
jgi:hypothetical protein